jgi:hypothetical protein
MHWQPTPPPLQYGIDYTFTNHAGREPVRWPSGSLITIRLTQPSVLGAGNALAIVVGEIRALTALDLVIGHPTAKSFNPAATLKGEIHVAYLASSMIDAPSFQCARKAGFGGAIRGTGDHWYTRGFAAVNADLAGSDPTSSLALTILRHELAHALGLGHAARPCLVMHYQLTSSVAGYGRGDQHGLRLLGQAPLPPIPPSNPTPKEVPPCAS